MADTSSSFLFDVLALGGAADAHGCGPDLHLLEMLLDRHATHSGTAPLIRHDGPLVARHHACPRASAETRSRIHHPQKWS